MVRIPRLSERHPLRRLGQRGQVLCLFGIIYAAIGVSLILVRDDPAAKVGYSKVLQYAPLEFWGGIWITVGVVAVICAFQGIDRDVWGFAAITGWTLIWASQAFFTLTEFGVLRSVIGVLVYTALAGISVIVAGMRGPDDD